MFTEALFTIAPTAERPSGRRQMKDEDVARCTVGCYSVVKRDETESFAVMRTDLESVIQSEVSQKEKNKYHILTHTCGI